MVDDLLTEWLRLARSFGGDEAIARRWWRLIDRHYAERHRCYHTLEHVRDVLLLLRSEAIRDRAAAEVAAWFHDVVYDPGRMDNEIKSATLAGEATRELLFPSRSADLAMRIILATVSHEGSDLPGDALLFLDADLAILGSDVARYDEYTQQIQQEYARLSEQEFRAGRRMFLRRLLARPNIYFTERFRDRFEARARENISRELSPSS